ncbi:Hypothetical protein FKW44_001955, partial [Caligus rogercresseyi]
NVVVLCSSNLRRGAPGLQPSGPPGSLRHRSNMPHIQDKDLFSNLDPLPSEMKDNYAEDEDSHAVF